MKATLDIANPPIVPPNGVDAKPIDQAAAETLDWDARIETPPRRLQGTIEIQLARGGRSRPIPAPDPRTD